MSFTLYFHPLASFCQKALVALYELDVPFAPRPIDLGDPADRAVLRALWPMEKFPVLRDEARGVVVAESSLIIEYVDRARRLLPADPDAARECRLRDRFFDLYVNGPMDRIVADRLRPEGTRDAYGVEQARGALRKAYAIADDWMAARAWALGDEFSMADCAAASSLHYADRVLPIGADYPRLAAYHDRLEQRPSFARVLAEAAPYEHLFPR